MNKKQYSAEEKYDILKSYESSKKSIREFFKEHDISAYSFYAWQEKYEKYGFQGLKKKSRTSYTKETKIAAIKMYLSGKYSLKQVSIKYNISDKSILRSWISKYNSHKEINSTPKELDKSMAKSRKTTLEERIEIVLYCIANSNDYKETAQKYNVSYSQVYTWVKKYKEDKEAGLKDKRGRKASETCITKEKQTEISLKAAMAKIKRLEAENALLKKLQEIERG